MLITFISNKCSTLAILLATRTYSYTTIIDPKINNYNLEKYILKMYLHTYIQVFYEILP